ncbi:uncharacterized protein LOC117245929 [Epinephelus lanceolatus]
MAVCRIRRLALVFVFMICDVCCRGQVFSPHLGQNITLTCQVSNSATIVAVWWARRDLKSEYVFYYRDGQSDTDIQHPSFQCRVVLAEDELKDGNLSVVLMNVNSSDYGEYTCGFKERKEGTVVKNEFTCNITLIKPDQHVTVHPGDDVTLRCEAGDVSIRAVEWTRPDLEPQYVLLYRHKRSDPTQQHPSFTGRVELVDRELKDGDVSLILKNVTSRDSGRYECRVDAGGSRRRKRAIIKTDPIRVIYLEVTGAEKENYMGGNFPHGHVGLGGVAVLLVAAAVSVAVWRYKRRTDQRSEQSAAADEAGNHQPMLTSAVCQVFSPHLGQNITLTCQVSNSATIVAVWWARRDLKSEYVFYYRDGQSDTDIQHPSFKSRVELAEGELKDGNLSVVLMNVNSSDYGEYTCGFKERKEETVVKNEFTCNIALIKPDQHVTVHPGDNVTLRCEAGDVSIRAVEWTRPDLEPQYVLFYRHKHSDPTHQHPSFTGRVELVDRELKDGDVSLTLKNVTSRDSGTYECRVKSGGSRRTKRAIIKTDPITVIYLEVTGAEKENYMGGNTESEHPVNGPFPRGHVGLGVAAVLFLAAVVFVTVQIYRRPVIKEPELSADDESKDDQLIGNVSDTSLPV